MTEKPKEEAPVEYKVLKAVFVNNIYVDPEAREPLGAERRGKDVIVRAAPGLESSALELVKGGKKGQGSGSEGSGSGDGSQGAPGKGSGEGSQGAPGK